jgi:hypothetical protein
MHLRTSQDITPIQEWQTLDARDDIINHQLSVFYTSTMGGPTFIDGLYTMRFEGRKTNLQKREAIEGTLRFELKEEIHY